MALTDKGKEQVPRIAQCPALLKHRGPDKQQHLIDEHFGMAHARLGIIDLSAQSDQPFTSHDGRFTIVYNGEVFNYKALREELMQKGHTFMTQGDVEVLVSLYREYGKAGLSRINGFFAFLLYDRREKTFFAARDRYGVKPFYYYQNADLFACASEMRALQALCDCKTINRAALYAYLQLTYVPEGCSMLQQVSRLEPGCCLFIGGGEVRKESYYSLSVPNHYSQPADPDKTLLELLKTAVKARMVSDVPVASFLSGGIDSSVITALAARQHKDLQTFSVGFKGNAHFDESKFAQLVADKYKTKHHTFYFTEAEAEAEIDNFLNAIDEPFADSSAFNVFVLAKKTKQHVKVVLSGDGADELFAGYNKHRAEWMLRNQKLMSRLLVGAGSLATLAPSSRTGGIANKVRQLERFSAGAKMTAPDRYWRWASFYSGINASALLRLNDTEMRAFKAIKSRFTDLINDDFNSVLLADMQLVLPGDMLVKADRMSMAHGLEVRSPFLDPALVEFAFSLEAKYKIDKTAQKKILKQSCAHLLPPEILNRKKHGFETPVQQWLQGVLRKRVDELLLDEQFITEQGLFDFGTMRQTVNKALSPDPGDTTAVVWALLIFNHWYKKHIG